MIELDGMFSESAVRRAERIHLIRGLVIPTVYTIGHSNQPGAEFLGLLKAQEVALLVDVRSKPRSRFGQFNRKPLQDRLEAQGIRYLYMGDALGGHPPEDKFYNVKGRVAYERVAPLKEFRRGIKRIVEESEQQTLALMCAEEDPRKCHRHPLLASTLTDRGVRVLHLRRNGTVQDASELIDDDSLQLPLFEPTGEDVTWQSPKRIRPRG